MKTASGFFLILRETVFSRPETCYLLENETELLDVMESEPVRHIRRGALSGQEHLLGGVQTFQHAVFLESLPRLEPQQVVEICSGKAQLHGALAYGRESCGRELSRGYALVKHPVEFPDHGLVLLLPGDELPFIKSGTIVQKQLYQPRNQCTAMRVNRMEQLASDTSEASCDYVLLRVRKVQGLLFPVVEEGIVPDMVVQGGTQQEVRVECEQHPLVRQGVVRVHPEYLSRPEEHHGSVGEVVIPPPAAATPVRAVLNEQDCVEIELDRYSLQVGVLKVEDTCLRVQDLPAEAFPALIDSLYLEYVFSHFCQDEYS